MPFLQTPALYSQCLYSQPLCSLPKQVQLALSPIRWLLLDVDGVLSDGAIIWDEHATESKHFSVKDGQGLRRLRQKTGIKTGIVTARKSKLVERRAEELDFDVCFQAVRNKLEVVQRLAIEEGVQAEHIAYMGDDWPDLPVLQWVGLPTCPANAITTVQQACLFITNHEGGFGAVRELTDLLEASHLQK
jgi:3-deoxy-D-manno-octulosonate 8-phosphate phosphatase (KDO 8-P phosphatase)